MGVAIERYRSEYGYPNHRFGDKKITHLEKWLTDRQYGAGEIADEFDGPDQSSIGEYNGIPAPPQVTIIGRNHEEDFTYWVLKYICENGAPPSTKYVLRHIVPKVGGSVDSNVYNIGVFTCITFSAFCNKQYKTFVSMFVI